MCKLCVAKIEEQARIDRKFAGLKTDAAKIALLLREIRTQKSVDPEGRIRTLSRPPAARGRNAKNIGRILRVGKKRYAEAKAKGVDFSVLPPDSKIRKRVEAEWNRPINPPPARGSAGRAAAKEKGTTTERGLSKQRFAINLRDTHPEFTHAQIAQKMTKRFKKCSVRQVQRYLNGC